MVSHDNITLKPAPARTFELPSFCTAESCSLVHLLMELPDPDERVKAAVNGAMEWLDLHKLYGIRVERFMTPEGKRDTHVVKDEKAGPVRPGKRRTAILRP